MTPREIALSICEPWFNGDPCEECKCHKVCTKLVERIEAAIQVVESTEAAHIPDATKMVEPVAYVTGFSKGYAVVQPVDRCLLMPVGMALYRSPPKREPMTDAEINGLELPASGTATIRDMVRLIERAHGIGGDE